GNDALFVHRHARYWVFTEPLFRVLHTGVLQAGNQETRQERRLDCRPHTQASRQQDRVLDESGREDGFPALLERWALSAEKATVRQGCPDAMRRQYLRAAAEWRVPPTAIHALKRGN